MIRRPNRFRVSSDTSATLHNQISKALCTLLSNALPGSGPRQDFDVVLNVHAATFGSFAGMPTEITWIHPGHVEAGEPFRLGVFQV